MSWDLDQPVVLLPCPGWLACPDGLYEVDGHQHFMKSTGRVRVRWLLPGCWEVLCPCCPERPSVAQVGSWEQAMRRAGQHARQEHQRLEWHYGPTDWDPDPGKRWHYDCPNPPGEVMAFEEGLVCGCGANRDYEEGE